MTGKHEPLKVHFPSSLGDSREKAQGQKEVITDVTPRNSCGSYRILQCMHTSFFIFPKAENGYFTFCTLIFVCLPEKYDIEESLI